jgi:hypothetical protein
MALAIGTALLTRTMPSSLSALATEGADVSANITSNGVQRLKMRFFMGVSCSAAHALSHGFAGSMEALRCRLKYNLALKSIAARYWPGDTPRLSNRLCNGISNRAKSAL